MVYAFSSLPVLCYENFQVERIFFLENYKYPFIRDLRLHRIGSIAEAESRYMKKYFYASQMISTLLWSLNFFQGDLKGLEKSPLRLRILIELTFQIEDKIELKLHSKGQLILELNIL